MKIKCPLCSYENYFTGLEDEDTMFCSNCNKSLVEPKIPDATEKPDFSKKQEIRLEDFCRDFYDNQILNPKIGVEIEVGNVLPEMFREKIVEVLPEFESISLQKIKEEITILRFELFALAWIHSFGDKLAVDQSIFTKNYLREKGREDIWDGMGRYNKAISHSVTSGLSKSNQAYIYKMRMDLFDEYVNILEKNGMPSAGIGLGLAINRMSSKEVWEKGIIPYFLMLRLCHRFGLGHGKDYYGPNEEAQFRLIIFIKGFYNGAQQSWDKVKIIN
jgi:hypothetical protein